MGLWDFIRELPVIDDLVDLCEAGGALLDYSESPAEYIALRGEMYWTEVGDTGQSTREWLLEQYSQVSVKKDDSGRILSGKWIDPHTGFTSSKPEDFDIDHRMPFRNIMRSYPEIYDLPQEEQLAIYNDLDNLQLIHDDNNLKKGVQPGDVYADSINNEGVRSRFLEDYRKYKERLDRKFSR